MAVYKTRRNYVDHDFNSTNITINKVHKAEGVNSLTVDRSEDKFSVTEVADGMAQFAFKPSRVGTFVLEILEASATNDVLWDLEIAGASFNISVLDANAPNLDCNSPNCHIVKKHTITRDGEAPMIEWTFLCTYLEMRGGSYTLEAA